MPYSLENLGPHEFERMVQALLVRLCGASVQVFGPGRDDGRDGAFAGRVVSTELGVGLGADWDGYHVFQAKFRERPATPRADKTWLLAQVRKELDRWTAVETSSGQRLRTRKGPWPEYYVVITNVALSGRIDGAAEEVESVIREHAASHEWPLRDCVVWDRAKIERLLDAFADVRHAFNGLITPGDVLAALAAGSMTLPSVSVEAAVPLLEEHARVELLAGGSISLGEAGQTIPQRINLAEIAVDLPGHLGEDEDASSRVRALRFIVTAGNRVLRPSVCGDASPHFLLMGGPGQGKTTLGKILVQTYRASLLADRPTLGPDVRGAVDATLSRAQDIGLPQRTVRRWPFRVDLAEYADVAGGGTNIPLIQFIAGHISKVTGAAFHAQDTRRWLTAWPWLLVLDGYDEVAAQPSREVVAKAVEALLQAARTQDADLLMVATTRPQGYGEELSAQLRKMCLLDLSPSEATSYATRLIDLRMGDDPEKPEALMRVAAAVTNEVTGRLMRTPLQVAIMSLLLEGRRKPPEDRAALFGSYYDIVYDREVNKKNHLATVLRDHRADVDDIHRTVGLRLQIASEEVGVAEALVSDEELRTIVHARLAAQEHTGRELDRLAAELTRAAQDRLVLLTAKAQGQVGFELRSIQEFMAARALTKADDDDVLHRLRVTAPSAHWRNTWLLAVGTIYRAREGLFERFLAELRALDFDDPLSLLVGAGPRLAVEILEDGVAAHSPKHVRLLTEHALEQLNGVALGAARLGEVLADLPESHAVTRKVVIGALQRAWDGSPDSHRAARQALTSMGASGNTGALATRARQMRSNTPRMPQRTPPVRAGDSVHLAQALPSSTQAWYRISPEGRFLADLRQIRATTDEDGSYAVLPGQITYLESASAVTADRAALERVVEAVAAIEEHNWSARSAISALLWIARQRLPVAAAISQAPERPGTRWRPDAATAL